MPIKYLRIIKFSHNFISWINISIGGNIENVYLDNNNIRTISNQLVLDLKPNNFDFRNTTFHQKNIMVR